MTISREQLRRAAENSSGLWSHEGRRPYRIRFDLRQIRDCTPPDSQTLIDRSPGAPCSPFAKIVTSSLRLYADSDLIASPHNVRFVFPNTDGELWARSDFLVRSSPYFKMLLSSDFAESVSVPSKRARSSKAKNLVAMDLDDEDVQDSDDETDGLYFNKHSPQSNKGDESQHPYKEIRITKTAFSTYRAVLAYLRTGHIAFAPLDSTFSSNPAADSSTRLSRIEAAVASDLSRPYPVSPKSTFCLAHLLELDQLQKQCLANLAKQLTVDGAPRELFDNTSVRHETWRRVIVTFAAKHWKEIKGSSSWLEMEGKISRDELPSSGSIMLELMKARDQLSGMHQQSLFKSFESEKTSRAA